VILTEKVYVKICASNKYYSNDFMQNDLLGLKISTLLNDVKKPEIPIYEIWQNNNKVGVFFTQQLAEKINTYLKEPKVYTKEEVQILLMQAWINGEANPNKHFSFRETWIENNL
jgi:hypothetical protein